jgi:hypothetical protein
MQWETKPTIWAGHAERTGPEVPTLWGEPPGRALLVLWGGPDVYMRDIFISNEIWTLDKIYILVRTLHV